MQNNINWLTPDKAFKLLQFSKEQGAHVILLVQMPDESFTLITLISWKGRDDCFLDAPLASFAFGEWNPYDYNKIAIVDSLIE